MNFFYILAGILLFSCLPILFLITKKASEGATMRRAIERAGGKFIPTHFFWYLGSVDKERCDFHVVYKNRVISVKVISLISSRVFLNFVDKSTYEIKTFGKTESFNDATKTYTKKKKKPYDFSFKRPKEYEKLPQARIILSNHPLPAKATKTVDGERVTLLRGANTGEGEFYRTSDFVKLFK